MGALAVPSLAAGLPGKASRILARPTTGTAFAARPQRGSGTRVTKIHRPREGTGSWALAAIVVGLLVLPTGTASAATDPSGPRIEKIEILGNEFVSDEAFLALTDIEVGDVYDPAALQREYRKIWDHGLFHDVVLESADAPGGGKILIFTVTEKPRVDSVTYQQVKSLTQDRIEEVLQQNDALVAPNTALDQERIGKSKKILEELMAAEGHPDARVTVVQRRVSSNRVALDFRIDPGPRIKIDRIDFTGNTVFSDDQLKGYLRQTREKGLKSMMSDKATFFRPRFEEDLEEVRKAYRSKGYIDVEIGEPIMRDARPGKSGKEDRQLVTLSVPITEGRPYRLGDLTISGNKVFPTSELRPLIPLAEGEVLNDSLLRLGISRIDNRYGDQGYLYAVTSPRYTPDERAGLADVDVQVTENDKYKVRRIEFEGNARTRDEVLRREMRLQEGDVFSQRDFLISTRKLAQLGFWELDGEPLIRPVESDEKEVDITVRGKEVGRNEIQLGGGYSGVDGFFATFSFSSRNFLGRGSQFSVSGQLGGETTRYSLTYVEPYFMKTRSSVGGSIFARDRNFEGFDQEGKGASVFWSYPTSTFSFFRTTAAFQKDKVISEASNVENSEFTTFTLTPAFTFDNRDNPFRPTRGRRLSTAVELGAADEDDPSYTAEYQQGTINFVKPSLGYTEYWRTFKKQYAAIHLEAGLIDPISKDGPDPVLSDLIDPPFLPVFERFFLGGEQSIRGVATRSVGPRVSVVRDGIQVDDTAIGGDQYFLANLEYSFPMSNIFEFTAFVDIGNAYGVSHVDVFDVIAAEHEDDIEIRDSDPFDVKATAGIEFRFHTPVLQQPLRLIYGCKVYGDFFDDEGSCDFQFSIGRTFQ